MVDLLRIREVFKVPLRFCAPRASRPARPRGDPATPESSTAAAFVLLGNPILRLLNRLSGSSRQRSERLLRFETRFVGFRGWKGGD